MNEQQEAQGPVNPAFTLDEGELDHGTQTKKSEFGVEIKLLR